MNLSHAARVLAHQEAELHALRLRSAAMVAHAHEQTAVQMIDRIASGDGPERADALARIERHAAAAGAAHSLRLYGCPGTAEEHISFIVSAECKRPVTAETALHRYQRVMDELGQLHRQIAARAVADEECG